VIALFHAKGPEEPALRRHSKAYTQGREDFLFGRPYRDKSLSLADRNAYACGWSREFDDTGYEA
jgi:hypothetical protein